MDVSSKSVLSVLTSIAAVYIVLLLVIISGLKWHSGYSVIYNLESMKRLNHVINVTEQGHSAVRNESCNSCFVHNFSYIINNVNACAQTNDTDVNLDLLFLITTTHSNFRNRQVLRSTWLTWTNKNRGSLRYVYLLGETNNQTLNEQISVESATYNDIVKEDFMDSYFNLTYKTLMGFKWAASFCRRARYVMKTDDDMWINVPLLVNFLKSQRKTQSQLVLYGACMKGHPHRHKTSKWYVPEHMYPENDYPMYCSGTGYVMNLKTVDRILERSQHVPFFYLEDIYVALCLKGIKGRTVSVKGFFQNYKHKNMCHFKSHSVLTSHQLSLEYIQQIWETKC